MEPGAVQAGEEMDNDDDKETLAGTSGWGEKAFERPLGCALGDYGIPLSLLGAASSSSAKEMPMETLVIESDEDDVSSEDKTLSSKPPPADKDAWKAGIWKRPANQDFEFGGS